MVNRSEQARQAFEISSHLVELANGDRTECHRDGRPMPDGFVPDGGMTIRQEALE